MVARIDRLFELDKKIIPPFSVESGGQARICTGSMLSYRKVITARPVQTTRKEAWSGWNER